MKNICFIVVLLITLGLTSAVAQSLSTSEDSFYTSRSAEHERLGILSSVFSQQANTNFTAAASTGLDNNQVLIQQIGAGNMANIQTRAQASLITVTQNGNFNDLDFNINAPEVNSTIIQNGNNNRVLDNIYYTNLPVDMEVLQNGSNLTVNRIGTNSLSNRMQLMQEGNNRTITIISN